MTPEQKRKFNTAVGGLFLGTGIIAWMLTVYFAATPNPPAPTPVLNAAKVDLPSCRAALDSLGYQASVQGEEVHLFEPLGADPKAQLERASLASSMCKLTMKNFCMGEGCEQPGLSMTLMRASEGRRPEPAAAASTPGGAPASAPKQS